MAAMLLAKAKEKAAPGYRSCIASTGSVAFSVTLCEVGRLYCAERPFTCPLSSISSVLVRQVKYLNNMIEQEHRAVKRVTKPIPGFKAFQFAKNVIAGIPKR